MYQDLPEKDIFWIGYTISPRYARKGYAYEVVEKMLDYIRSNGNKRVCAGVDHENLPSIALLEKLGFSYIEHDEGDDIYAITF